MLDADRRVARRQADSSNRIEIVREQFRAPCMCEEGAAWLSRCLRNGGSGEGK